MIRYDTKDLCLLCWDSKTISKFSKIINRSSVQSGGFWKYSINGDPYFYSKHGIFHKIVKVYNFSTIYLARDALFTLWKNPTTSDDVFEFGVAIPNDVAHYTNKDHQFMTFSVTFISDTKHNLVTYRASSC